MWFKKQLPTVGALSNVAYARWLRAGSPQPLVEFLTYGEDVQETLATAGDDFARDRAGLRAEEIVTEISDILESAGALVDRVKGGDEAAFAEQTALASLKSQKGVGPTRGPTMGGVSRRRAERSVQDQRDRGASRRFCGLSPDPVPDPENPADDDAQAEAAKTKPLSDRPAPTPWSGDDGEATG